MNFLKIIKISRPRFWLYEFGMYIVGVAASGGFIQHLHNPLIYIYGFFFLVPANILIYGVNDVYDYETDKKNPRKTDYESLIPPEQHKTVLLYAFVVCIPFIITGIFLSFKTEFSLLLFLFFAIFYSAPPIRAKSKPVLDSIFSASHYVVTAIFGFYISGGHDLVPAAVIAALLWAVAMHAYSAVPDIYYDLAVDIHTIATFFKKSRTIFICTALYITSAYVSFQFFPQVSYLLVIPYIILMMRSLSADEKKLATLYTYFPPLNALVGMIIFFLIALQK